MIYCLLFTIEAAKLDINLYSAVFASKNSNGFFLMSCGISFNVENITAIPTLSTWLDLPFTTL